MKFLVIYRENTTLSAVLPPPVIWDMVEATAGWIDEMKASGKATEAAFLSPTHGGMAVFNASSHAELIELTESCPAAPICTFETIALVDTKEFRPVFKKIRERGAAMLDKMQAMMPKK